MVKGSKKDILYIVAQAVILVLIVSLPLHFYINSELENISYKDKDELRMYAKKVENKIYRFSNSNEKVFYFPRSNIFKSAIYDSSFHKIFSLLDKNIKPESLGFFTKEGSIYFVKKLKQNVLNATYLVVQKRINHARLILNVIVILAVVAFLVFLATFFIIKQTLEPYKKFNLYLENFIKDAMHEMKTPIGVILLNLDGLDSLYKNNKMIKRAKSAIKNMMVVYEDLEFFVRKKSIEHPKKRINLSVFVKERVEFFMDLLNSKEIEVSLHVKENIFIDFSPLELSRIIDNTLSNAIKYSKNRTKIDIMLYDNENEIVLEIKDEGRGIEDTKKIFQRYYRGDKISGGFGIGLSIVKHICDKNGVDIKVNSEQAKGSLFTFIFRKKI